MSKDFKDSSDRSGQLPVNIGYNEPWEQVNSKPTAWNDFIAGIGLHMEHWAYIPYVIGSTEQGSIRNYDEQTVKKNNDHFVYDNNGMYKYMGNVFVIWQGNSKNLTQLPAGYYPDSTAVITVNRNYTGTNTVVGLSEFDKLVPIVKGDPIEFASVNWEQVRHNPTGIDRLMFKAVKIDMLVDANGMEYFEGRDFIVENGNIKWLQSGSRPGLDNLSGEGVIFSVRYRYVPTFYVKYASHELRSHATIDPVTGLKKEIRGPMACSVQIDWVFLQALKNQESAGDSAKNAGTGGNTGPR